MRILFIGLVVASCNYPNIVIGTTKCGMPILVSKLEGDGGFPPSSEDGDIAWTIESVNAAEAKTVELFNAPEMKDKRLNNACEKIRGLTLIISKKSIWNYNGRPVAGNAQCGDASLGQFPWIMVGTSRPHKTAFAHEMAHFLQDCKPVGEQNLKLGESVEHAGWHEYGIYDAIGWYWTQMEKMGY
jgi:hypothetical protein